MTNGCAAMKKLPLHDQRGAAHNALGLGMLDNERCVSCRLMSVPHLEEGVLCQIAYVGQLVHHLWKTTIEVTLLQWSHDKSSCAITVEHARLKKAA
eukprot:CAMPEP_0194486424 /NCGR_PEP_ID=MMETSP0253-20130528/7085_1 /TAXON_ID=2966 /ORGANISM="Noctiluca scintillans" /LENGTH=95 /DNA_ID=CAMNT_0039326515 /DNA_START=173 /DNA_END=461 /DNA_ORIENTATION=+